MIEPTDLLLPLRPTEIADSREELGITQEQLAGVLRTTHSTIWRWETGHATPGIPSAVAFTLRSLVRYKHLNGLTAEDMGTYITSGFRTAATI